MIQKLGISKYLVYSIFILSFVCFTAFGVTSWLTSSNINKLLGAIANVDNQGNRSADAVEELSRIQGSFINLVSISDVDELEKKFNAGKKLITELKDMHSKCKTNCQEVLDVLVQYEQLYITTVEEYIFLGKKAEAIDLFITKIGPQFEKILQAMQLRRDKLKSGTQNLIKEAEQTSVWMQTVMFSAFVFILMAFLAFGFLLRKTMVHVLNNVASNLTNSASVVDERINEMVKSSEYLASSAVEQASVVHETIAVVEEMNAMVGKSADTSRDSAASSEQGTATAQSGKEIMADMLKAFEEIGSTNVMISDQLKNNTNEISRIVKVIEEISDKTKVINDIVFQTKLLSFNASVEAARAGEKGKGFSIVAQEVGNLAEMSGQASKEISNLLASSFNLVNGISKQMGEQVNALVSTSDSKLKEGSEKAHRCEVMFDEIVKITQMFASDMKGIYSSTNEHTKAIKEIVKAINEIDANSQKNQSVAQQTTEVVQNLAEQTNVMRESIADLTTLVSGISEHRSSRPGSRQSPPRAYSRAA